MNARALMMVAAVAAGVALACGSQGASEGAESGGTEAAATCGSTCTACVLGVRTDILPFYQRNGWDTGCGNRDAIVANWCGIDPSGCNAVKTGACAASCGTGGCGSPCTQCVLGARTDILPFYRQNGWDTGCGNRDAIVANWCGIDPSGCNAVKTGTCAATCGVSPVDPYCTQNCGCDAQGRNCNFGTRLTDGWCKCCARNCGGNQAACVQQGYQGDRGFPAGTARHCGCINPTGNGHDFTLASAASLSSCYSNLRANSAVTSGYQVIWHPGASNCSSGQHMHIASSSATGLYRFGIDCLGQSTYGGQACTYDRNYGCYYLWQGAR
jgi:hypothetical protein